MALRLHLVKVNEILGYNLRKETVSAGKHPSEKRKASAQRRHRQEMEFFYPITLVLHNYSQTYFIFQSFHTVEVAGKSYFS